eukprot:SRR837773.22244.p2 GENE.SRR837773.22244~~SRR837773.22244.p2  ORF type:complete len:173 (-),score=115.80 SRR837773.22244:48-542(-)
MAAEEPIEEGQDLYYVSKTALEGLTKLIKEGKKGDDDLKPLLEKITQPDTLPAEEIMLPVDMRGAGEDFESVEEIVEKLGAAGAAEVFVKARAYFEENKDKEPEDERPKPMTAGEWKAMLEEDDDLLEGEEEDLLEDEEEDLEDGEEEEAEGDGEPAAKKAKTG